VPVVDLVVEPWRLSVCRLHPDAPWPEPRPDAHLHSVTRTPDELSVVCVEGDEPRDARVEPGWRALRIVGPLAFELVGIVASVSQPLAGAPVGVFVLSTFDTDLVLVKDADLLVAVAALEAAGHTVTTAPD
jgi:uncharacterized protein